jgi:hypothetical protein
MQLTGRAGLTATAKRPKLPRTWEADLLKQVCGHLGPTRFDQERIPFATRRQLGGLFSGLHGHLGKPISEREAGVGNGAHF